MSETKQQALKDITQAVMYMLDGWRLDNEQMRGLLGLPDDVKARMMNRYRDGQASLPDDPRVLRRAQYLMRISDSLRTAYPMNPRMAARWIHQRQRRFNSRTPLSMILDGGEEGLMAVLAEVDCTFSWDMTGSTPATYNS